MPLLSSLVQCTMCILNTLARNGRYPDIAATAIQRLCKTVKVPETLPWKLWKGGQLNVDGAGWIWGQWKPWNMARSSLWKGTRLGWTITQAAIEARDESKAKSVDHSTPDRQYWTSRWLIIPEKTPGGNKKKSLGVKMAASVSLFQSTLLPLFFLLASTTSKVQWSCNQCRVRTL